MDGLIGFLGSGLDLLLVLIAFGSIVFVHELGHFLAARWAGVSVTAFAIGWGPPIVSWRRGVGVRRGSSAREASDKVRVTGDTKGVGFTEYRLSWFPLGGYVKMVGQDDLDPNATSQAPGSWQSVPPWKRMIVISAGVVMNLITAAALFVIVFSIGLKTQPPIIGQVRAGSPAAEAVATNADQLGLSGRGLLPGDEVVRVNGDDAEEFTQLMVEAAMSRRDTPVVLDVRRDGVEDELRFEVMPKRGATSGLLELGIGPARSNRIDTERESGRPEMARQLALLGHPEVSPGDSIVAVNGEAVSTGSEIKQAIDARLDQDTELTLRSLDGSTTTVTVRPEAELLIDYLPVGDTSTLRVVRHLFGLTPVMRVNPRVAGEAPRGGLEPGDVFARLGQTEFPAIHEGIPEIQRAKGGPIDVTVLRAGETSATREGDLAAAERIDLTPPVNSKGQIGFFPDTTEGAWAIVARPPNALKPIDGDVFMPAATELITAPGTRIVAINGQPTPTLSALAAALREIAQPAIEAGTGLDVDVTLQPPSVWMNTEQGDTSETITESWTIPAASVARLRDLGATTTLYEYLAPSEIVLRGEGPVGALGHGFRRTKQVMAQTYLTLARLFHGTVRIEHLRGPVGIAHIGTQIADRGFVWLLFFTALVSVNLAVINFLPLPIVDGGQFLFLLYEQIRGKAPPAIIQELSVIAGILLIATVFVIVTFNDLVGLFGG